MSKRNLLVAFLVRIFKNQPIYGGRYMTVNVTLNRSDVYLRSTSFFGFTDIEI